jgi:hypothetical protein
MTDELTRRITSHHDGYGLNDDLTIFADERDPKAGNGSHTYILCLNCAGVGREVGVLQFQHGPRNVEGSVPGVLDPAVLQVIIDRYEGFQSGPFACEENAAVLRHLLDAKAHMVMRANTRNVQRVLGQNAAHKS